MRAERIRSVEPAAGIPGGELRLRLQGVTADLLRDIAVQFGNTDAHLVSISTSRALVLIPDIAFEVPIPVTITTNSASQPDDNGVQFTVGKKLAGSVHPVTNPCFDPKDGALFVTRSGSRGEHVPVSLFRIETDGTIEEFSGDIMNPTSIGFDRTGRMFVTSRADGTVYRITDDRQVVAFASDLGIVTGLAFN